MAVQLNQIKTDFSDVVTFLKNKNIMPTDPDVNVLSCAKKIHRLTYSFIWWRFRFSRGRPDYQKVFLYELASDALQILPQALMGYQKTTTLLIRGVIENVLRHIYFFDHPIEFQKANSNKEWHLPVKEHFSYLKTHPLYTQTEKEFDAIGRLSNLYRDLSVRVHGMKLTHMEMRPGLKKNKLQAPIFVEQLDFIRRCAESSNFLLAVFHKDAVLKLPQDDQQIIRLTFPAKARRILLGLS